MGVVRFVAGLCARKFWQMHWQPFRALDRFFRFTRPSRESDLPSDAAAQAPAESSPGEPVAAETFDGQQVPDHEAEVLAAREERLAERLLEDERLRGDLEDDAWQPIQDWALVAIKHVAATTAGLSEEAAQAQLDRGQEALWEAIGILTDVLSSGPGSADGAERLEALAELLESRLILPDRATNVHEALQTAAEQLAAEGADAATAAHRLLAALANPECSATSEQA
jgi:hypothetical protein